MANIYGPILPLQLDPRNTSALVRDTQTKIFLESGGELNDFSPASPLSALVEGQVFAQAELLYYLNSLPEAYTLQWFRQLGMQRQVGAKAVAEVTFIKNKNFSRSLIIPKGTVVSTSNRLNFILQQEVRISDLESSAVGRVLAEKWGSVYNVSVGAIEKINVNILGLDRSTNFKSAAGGKDLESIESLKGRAFSLLRRRGLVSSEDYELEVNNIAPEAAIVKVLTYEERFSLDQENLSGNVVICCSDNDGNKLTNTVIKNISDSIRKKVPLGNTVSFLSPEICPVETSVSIEYDDELYTGGINTFAFTVNEILKELINPSEIDLGDSIDYQKIFNAIYDLEFSYNIKSLYIKLLQLEPKGTDQLNNCNAPFVSELINEECVDAYDALIDGINVPYTNTNPIKSYRSYKNIITFIAKSNQAPLKFTFTDPDYDAILRS